MNPHARHQGEFLISTKGIVFTGDDVLAQTFREPCQSDRGFDNKL